MNGQNHTSLPKSTVAQGQIVKSKDDYLVVRIIEVHERITPNTRAKEKNNMWAAKWKAGNRQGLGKKNVPAGGTRLAQSGTVIKGMWGGGRDAPMWQDRKGLRITSLSEPEHASKVNVQNPEEKAKPFKQSMKVEASKG